MAIQELDSNFKTVNNGLVVIYFFLSNNEICDKFTPVVREISDEIKNVEFYGADLSEHPELAEEYEVVNVPTILIIKNGQVVGQGEGASEKDSLKEHIQTAIKDGS